MPIPSTAQIHFNPEGLPVATTFADIYFNPGDGLAESRYVFLQHNDLPARWQQHPRPTFVIAETGFGSGLNLLACWQALRQHAPSELRLHFISFEQFPLPAEVLPQIHQHFPELAALSRELCAAYQPTHQGCQRLLLDGGRVVVDLWLGDLLEQLPLWLPGALGRVDAWFLDGFAPDKNPRMWQPELYHAMAQSAQQTATFATFTAAGAVRRGLQAAGFHVERRKGFGHKREMLAGHISASSPLSAPPSRVTVIGGGIAAACAVIELQARGLRVEWLSPALADGASGNAQGAVYPLLQVEESPTSQLFLAAFAYAQQFYRNYCPQLWQPVGVLQLGFNAERQQRQQKIADGRYSKAMVEGLSASATQQLWPALPPLPSLHYPQAGWLPAAQVVAHLQQQSGLTPTVIAPITALHMTTEGYQLHTQDGQRLQRPCLVLALGAGLQPLLQQGGWRSQNVRGQISQVAANAVSAGCPKVICYKGYFTPAWQGQHCLGATYARRFREEDARQPRQADDEENLALLQDNLAAVPWTTALTLQGSRAALRHTTHDHLPLLDQLDQQLWVFGGLGSRGFTSAPLLAALLAAELAQTPLPLSADLRRRLSVARLASC